MYLFIFPNIRIPNLTVDDVFGIHLERFREELNFWGGPASTASQHIINNFKIIEKTSSLERTKSKAGNAFRFTFGSGSSTKSLTGGKIFEPVDVVTEKIELAQSDTDPALKIFNRIESLIYFDRKWVTLMPPVTEEYAAEISDTAIVIRNVDKKVETDAEDIFMNRPADSILPKYSVQLVSASKVGIRRLQRLGFTQLPAEVSSAP